MSLFTNPVTLNDGTARSFELIGTYTDGTSLCGDYIETAAAAALESKILVRQHKKTGKRSANMLASQVCATSDGRNVPITASFTLRFDPKHAQADVEMMSKRIAAGMAATNFHVGMAIGRV